MGNTLAPMQSRFASAAVGSSERDAKETLDRLEEMAHDRIDLFYDKIGHDDRDKKLIPIDKVLNKFTYIGVSVEEDGGIWVQEVDKAVNQFAFGPIAQGLSLLATNNITRMLTSNAGQRQIVEGYTISIDWLGGISRLDYYFFVYTFCSSELVRKRTSLIAACVVESSAVVKGMDDNTLRVIIARAFRGGDVPRGVLSAIYTQLTIAMKQPNNALSLTDDDKQALSGWYKSSNVKLVTNGDKHAPASPVNHDAEEIDA